MKQELQAIVDKQDAMKKEAFAASEKPGGQIALIRIEVADYYKKLPGLLAERAGKGLAFYGVGETQGVERAQFVCTEWRTFGPETGEKGPWRRPVWGYLGSQDTATGVADGFCVYAPSRPETKD